MEQASCMGPTTAITLPRAPGNLPQVLQDQPAADICWADRTKTHLGLIVGDIYLFEKVFHIAMAEIKRLFADLAKKISSSQSTPHQKARTTCAVPRGQKIKPIQNFRQLFRTI